jgi:2-methylcitrate dehydratase PrpD
MQPAYAARSALWAAFLAARGVTGAQQALEGKAGFFRVYVGSDPPALEEVTAEQATMAVERIWIKQFPSCGLNHRATQAAIELSQGEDLQPEEIAEVDLWESELSSRFVGAPFQLRRHPQVDAQFSVTYGVALGLLYRAAGPAYYKTERIEGDRAAQDLARRVRIHVREGASGAETHRRRIDKEPVTLQVRTRDGRTLSRTVLQLQGDPDDPMSYGQVADKFRECADYAEVWPRERAEALISRVETFQAVTDVHQFIRAGLVPGEGAMGSE